MASGLLYAASYGAILRLQAAYRFAAITLTIILLIPHEHRPWIVATHRFVEVSLGIAVALLTTLALPVAASQAKAGGLIDDQGEMQC